MDFESTAPAAPRIATAPNRQAYVSILLWLGRDAGHPLFVVSQKALTGHAKGGAAAWQLAGLCQGLASGIVPGNPNLDDPDPAMRRFDRVAFTDRPVSLPSGRFEAGLITSLGFGHVGGIVVLVHPDRVLAALDDEAYRGYSLRRSTRERTTLVRHRAIVEGREPAVRIRTDKAFIATLPAHAGFEPEHAALLDASSRRIERGGPIVAGGRRS